MSPLRLIAALLLLSAWQPACAQLNESIQIRIPAEPGIAPGNDDSIAAACAEAELLLMQGCYGEAAAAFSTQIRRFSIENNQAGLDRACAGLFRARLLSGQTSLYNEALSLCRPEIVDPLLQQPYLEPMFITHPAIAPPADWLKNAKPGFPYTVSVEFDIDEFGKADNFVFDAKQSYYLRFPVLDALKNTRYLPAMQDGKPVKRSKNVVEVTFCLQREADCGD